MLEIWGITVIDKSLQLVNHMKCIAYKWKAYSILHNEDIYFFKAYMYVEINVPNFEKDFKSILGNVNRTQKSKPLTYVKVMAVAG